MELKPADKLGPYEIVSAIGKGGMGEVWRARDPRLGRDVAIKISAQRFTDRFEREARAIAALNHSNICTLFDVGPNYLVMEYIDGPTLAERIEAGPIPLPEALGYAKQIADALEAAHEKGIVHRDLKPANIKIRQDGSVKVLDFGLAKAGEAQGVTSDSPTPDSPTMMPGTQMGMILGTAGYMSPEQARGKQVDKRADIWAFGVVLYEMVTGKRLFEGETVSDTLAAVLKEEPDLTRAPATTRRLLSRCLEKDAKNRLRDIGDAMALVDTELASAAPLQSRFGIAGWIAAVFALAFGALSWIHFRETPPERQHIRFQVAPPPGILGGFKLSPDGRFLALLIYEGGVVRIWVRALDSLETRLLTSSPDAEPYQLFWSADGEYVGFSAKGKLYKIARAGGPAVAICDLPAPGTGFLGAAWRSDGTILFGLNGVIYRVFSSGGTPNKVVSDAAFPVWLTKDRFLFSSRTNGIFAGNLNGAKPSPLLPDTSMSAFVPPAKSGLPGHILFLRAGNLLAQPIDAEKGELRGDAFPLAERVGSLGSQGFGAFSASATGVLVFAQGMSADRQLVWLDRTGKKLQTVSRPFSQAGNPAIRLSPDNSRAIVPIEDANGKDLWIADLNRNALSRFTFDGSFAGIWSPDGRMVLWAAGDGNRYLRSADGSGKDELVYKNPTCDVCYPYDWSSDGKRIAFTERTDQTEVNIWLVDFDGDRKPYPYIESRFREYWAQISPDGRWMAYISDQPGRPEILVESIPAGKGRWQISTDGGDWPVWRRDGKELFFRQGTQIMAAPIRLTETSVESGKPQALFEVSADTRFQVSRDGQRFLIALPAQDATATSSLTADTDWRAGVSK
jgi:Tol biopolymer transport system component/predicted Ser/Thr protein kinase